jgi:hypothetical protein
MRALLRRMQPLARRPYFRALGECVPSVFAGLCMGLVLAPIVLGCGLAVYAIIHRQPLESAGFALLIALFAWLPAAPVTFVAGLPAYAWLVHRGWASYLTAALAALAIALPALALDPAWALLVAVYGICIALATHGIHSARPAIRAASPVPHA